MQGLQFCGCGLYAVKEVSHEMNPIEVGSQETDQMLMRISGSLEEQGSAVRQIKEKLMNLNGICRSNAFASKEITAMFLELAKLAEATCNQAERFTV